MTEFAPADFAPLDDFPLIWRWTSEAHHLLSTEALATIRPLSPGKAAELAPEAAALCAPRPVSAYELTISAEWDDPGSVAARLAELPVAPDQAVVAGWDARTAVVTLWGTFARHWGAFCYPSSDDVTVWAPGGDWVLCYRHFQFIEFGRRATA